LRADLHVGCGYPTARPLLYVTLPHAEDQGHIVASPECIVSGEGDWALVYWASAYREQDGHN
jgi:hypothetical protein